MNDMEELFHAQSRWSQITFGPYEARYANGGRVGLIKHIEEEAQEILDARPEDLPEEMADLMILVMELVMMHGFSYNDLVNCVAAKHVKNRMRKWPQQQDPRAPINHER